MNHFYYRVNDYIKYGWDQCLVNPDQGANTRHKVSSLAAGNPQYSSLKILDGLPDVDDPKWTSKLYELPKVTFGTIFDFLLDSKVKWAIWKVLLTRADIVTDQENDAGGSMDEDSLHEPSNNGLLGVPVEYTRTLEKANCFYEDGHVQKVKFHPMPKQSDHICVTANVLPSKKKHRMYKVVIIIIMWDSCQSFYCLLFLSSRTCRVL